MRMLDVVAQVVHAGFGLTEVDCNSILISIQLRVLSCPFHQRNKGLWGRGPDITSGHFHIPPLTSLSHGFLYFLVWMEESVAAGVWPENIILKLP